jgi:hypothetical protein
MRKIFVCLPVVLLVIALSWSSCKKDDLVSLQGGCDTCQVGVCDTSFTISYANDIVPILEANCYICHNKISAPVQAEGIVLDDYNSLAVYAENGNLLIAVKHSDPGNVEPMPKDDDKLSDCKIARIEAWVRNDYPNN